MSYRTGTITLNNGSPTVTGAGTSWVDVGILNPGDILYAPDGRLYEVQTIGSNTGITLTDNYLGANVSGAAYKIFPIGLLPSALAQQVKAALVAANAAVASAVRADTNAQNLNATQQQNARTNIGALGAADVGSGGQSINVAGNANVTLSAAQAAAHRITLTGVLTGNIIVYTNNTVRGYVVDNQTTGAYTITFAVTAASGVVVPQGRVTAVECDGTNIVPAKTAMDGCDIGQVTAGKVTATQLTSTSTTYLGGASGAQSVRVTAVSNAVNYADFAGAVTGGYPYVLMAGNDADIGFNINTKGSGATRVYSRAGAALQLVVQDVSSAVNFAQIAGAATGNSPSLSAQGTDTDVNYVVRAKGAGSLYLQPNGLSQVVVPAIASAVNYQRINGAATGNAVEQYAQGSDSNINFDVFSKGTSGVRLRTNAATLQANVAHTGSAVNYLDVTGGVASDYPRVRVDGADSVVGLYLMAKGAQSTMRMAATNGAATLSAVIDSTYVNNHRFMGATTGNAPGYLMYGADANIPFSSSVKGAADHFFRDGSGVSQFIVVGTASQVNRPCMQGSATGNAITTYASGSDADIDYAIAPKGAGYVKLGTWTSNADAAVNGYVSIKDAAGNVRKLATIA